MLGGNLDCERAIVLAVFDPRQAHWPKIVVEATDRCAAGFRDEDHNVVMIRIVRKTLQPRRIRRARISRRHEKKHGEDEEDGEHYLAPPHSWLTTSP